MVVFASLIVGVWWAVSDLAYETVGIDVGWKRFRAFCEKPEHYTKALIVTAFFIIAIVIVRGIGRGGGSSDSYDEGQNE